MTGKHHAHTATSIVGADGAPLAAAMLAAVQPGTTLVAEVTAIAPGSIVLTAHRWVPPDPAGMGRLMVLGAADITLAAGIHADPLDNTEAAPRCTHGGDCIVHPSAGGLHDYTEVEAGHTLDHLPPYPDPHCRHCAPWREVLAERTAPDGTVG